MQPLLQPIDLPLYPDPFARYWPYPLLPCSLPHPHQHPLPASSVPNTHLLPWSRPPSFAVSIPPMPALPDQLPVPDLEPPSSPSDLGSPMSTVAPPTPSPEFVHVVCNAPLLAPKPLPYRPPAFLHHFELPDPDEDLSHPPYTTSRAKRKRLDEDDEQTQGYLSKRRATEASLRRLPTSSLNGLQAHRRGSR